MALDKMKKLGILILIAFILGLFRVFIIYTPSGNNISSLLNIKWYYYLLIFIYTFYVTLTIHELGHLFSFLCNKVKIRALYLTFFVFVKENNKLKLKIYLPLVKLLGGLVVPNLDKITNDEQYEKTKNTFIKALITAPIVTFGYFVISVVLILVFSFFVKPTFFTSFLYIHFLFVLPISVLYIISFKINTNNMYGDLVAYKKIKEDEIFAFAQLYQYSSFSSLTTKKTSKYFHNKAIHLLKEAKNFYNYFTKNLLLVYLTKVVEDNFLFNEELHVKIMNTNFHNLRIDELTYNLIHTLIPYYYITNNVNKAYDIFLKIKNQKTDLDEKLISYMNKKTAHLINYELNDQFLDNNENIYIGDYWIFKPIFPNLYEDIKKTHKTLVYKPYICEVYNDIN